MKLYSIYNSAEVFVKKGPESQLVPYDQIQTKIILRSKIINMKDMKNHGHEWLHDFMCTNL